MAVEILEVPTIKSVYRPMIWRFKSSLFPATGVGFFGFELRRPTAQELLDFPTLKSEDIIITHPPFIDPIYPGQTWLFSFSDQFLYFGKVFRITALLDSGRTVVSGTYLGADTNLSGVQTASNFTLYALVQPSTFEEPVKVALKPILIDGEYQFELDVRDILARAFLPITDVARLDSRNLILADNYIAMDYTVTAYEAYDVVSAANVITFTEFKDDAVGIGDYCYNVAHPYHQVERNGDVVLDWQSNSGDAAFVNYEMTEAGDLTKRFLTYNSRTTQTVRSDDSFFLSFIHPGFFVRFVLIKYYNSQDQQLGTLELGTRDGRGSKGRSWIINVGPWGLTNMPAGTTYYTAQVVVDPGGGLGPFPYSEIMRLNLVPCKGVNKRWYYLNKLGGVDQFTFEGDETRSINVKRSTVSKSSMHTMTRQQYGDPSYTFRGDWNRKVWSTDVQRKYTLTSGYLKPADLRRAVEDMFESPHIFTAIRSPWWTPVIILSNDVPADSNTARPERLVIQYELGVDDVTQRR